MNPERKHHRDRVLKKRRDHWGGIMTTCASYLVIDTPTPCGCWMCGNPRRYFGERTVQEKSFDQRKLQEL